MRTKQFIPFAVVSLAATLHGQGSIISQSEFWFKYEDTPVTTVGSTFDGRSQRPEERLATIVTINGLRNPLAERDRRQIQRAIAAANHGDHRAAIDQLAQLLLKHPRTRPYVTSVRGAEYLELGAWDEAEADLREAVRLMPGAAMNHFNYALALIRKGQIDAAELHATRSLQLGYSVASAKLLRVIEELRREQGRP